VSTTSSAREALPLTPVVDVVVTDMSMPGEDGAWLLAQVEQSRRPGLAEAVRSLAPIPGDSSRLGAPIPVIVLTGLDHRYFTGAKFARVREVLKAGKLPNRRPDSTWGGSGVGAPCAVCDLPITHDQLEFEIEFARNGDNPGLDKYHVHVRCFAAWEFERRRDDH
jgi:hypothetical protein